MWHDPPTEDPRPAGFWARLREALRGSEQDYTRGSLTRPIFLLAIPTVLEMVMQSAFMLVDSLFVSRLGSEAMAVVGLTAVLFVFNLIPLPPMDGSAVIQLFMSESAAQSYQRLMANGMWSLVGLIAAWRFFPTIFRPLFYGAVDLLYRLPT